MDLVLSQIGVLKALLLDLKAFLAALLGVYPLQVCYCYYFVVCLRFSIKLSNPVNPIHSKAGFLVLS